MECLLHHIRQTEMKNPLVLRPSVWFDVSEYENWFYDAIQQRRRPLQIKCSQHIPRFEWNSVSNASSRAQGEMWNKNNEMRQQFNIITFFNSKNRNYHKCAQRVLTVISAWNNEKKFISAKRTVSKTTKNTAVFGRHNCFCSETIFDIEKNAKWVKKFKSLHLKLKSESVLKRKTLLIECPERKRVALKPKTILGSSPFQSKSWMRTEQEFRELNTYICNVRTRWHHRWFEQTKFQ